MAETGRNFPQSREVHSRDFAEIRHDGLQVHGDTHRGESEEDGSFILRFGEPYYVQTTYWILDVPGEYQA